MWSIHTCYLRWSLKAQHSLMRIRSAARHRIFPGCYGVQQAEYHPAEVECRELRRGSSGNRPHAGPISFLTLPLSGQVVRPPMGSVAVYCQCCADVHILILASLWTAYLVFRLSCRLGRPHQTRFL